MTALKPAAAIALAVRLLDEAGFAVSARNERGDSVYCRRTADTPAIRVSNHARTPRQRKKHPDVATSLVIREPRTPEQVTAMVRRRCVAGGWPLARGRADRTAMAPIHSFRYILTYIGIFARS